MNEQDTQTVERVAADCPWGCKAKHGLAKGQRDMHGDLNQNYAVWCDHARITAADKVRAFEMWNTRSAMPDTTAQAARIEDLEKALDDKDGMGLWRFWSSKAAELAEKNSAQNATIKAMVGALEWLELEIKDNGFSEQGPMRSRCRKAISETKESA